MMSEAKIRAAGSSVGKNSTPQKASSPRIAPGHGLVATRADLQDYRGMLVQIRQKLKDLIAAGKTMDEVVGAAPTKDFDAKWGGGYVSAVVFTKMVFSSLAGASSAHR